MQTTAKKSSKFTKKNHTLDDMKFVILYLTDEVEFGQDILQNCVSSYHLHV